jgi:hypothetical protein
MSLEKEEETYIWGRNQVATKRKAIKPWNFTKKHFLVCFTPAEKESLEGRLAGNILIL